MVDNLTWRAASDTVKEPNNLYENYGETWKKFNKGYANKNLATLPKATTETGITIGSWDITEEMQGKLQLNCFLSQYKRGYSYTAIYLLRDRTDEKGNQTFGFYQGNYAPRAAATYLHNFTTILKDTSTVVPGQINYSIPNQPATTHDLLLQKNDSTYALILWGERYTSGGADTINVSLGVSFKTVNIYDPTTGTSPLQTLADKNTVKVATSDHPVIIEFSGADSTQIVQGVSVNPATATVSVGHTVQLTATVTPLTAVNKNVNWSSSDNTIATVDATGLVTGIKAGTAIVTVTTFDGGFKATSSITVEPVHVTGVTVTPATANINVNETVQLTATVSPDNAGDKAVTWSSSNTSVATVNNDGLVTGITAGSATITATTKDGNKTSTSQITVTSPTAIWNININGYIIRIFYVNSYTLRIEITLNNSYLVKIINLQGRILKSFKGNEPATFNIQKGEFPAGVYLININDGKKEISKKIVLF